MKHELGAEEMHGKAPMDAGDHDGPHSEDFGSEPGNLAGKSSHSEMDEMMLGDMSEHDLGDMKQRKPRSLGERARMAALDRMSHGKVSHKGSPE